uniref:RRM domain-containing protein n=1 Tax=Plectus sambesii TaxID=2011161 RepID=A0A914WSY2_9BILA
MGTRVYVGRVPYRAGERDLERFFRGYGKIVEVILKNGYGFVEFADYRDADDAVHDLSGRELMGERISVELAKGTPRGRDRNGWQPPPGGRSSGGRGGGDRRGGDDRRRDDRRFGAGGGSSRKRDTERTDYRLIVENLSSKVSWQSFAPSKTSLGPSVSHRHTPFDVLHRPSRLPPTGQVIVVSRPPAAPICLVAPRVVRSRAPAVLSAITIVITVSRPVMLIVGCQRTVGVVICTGNRVVQGIFRALARRLTRRLTRRGVIASSAVGRSVGWVRRRPSPSPSVPSATDRSEESGAVGAGHWPAGRALLAAALLQDLKDAFRSVGEVTYADAHGKHKNEGLVEFATREDMKKAMDKMDGKELQGRKIKLTEEKASKRRSRSRSKDRKKDHSASRSRSRSGSGSRSRSGEPDEKADKNGKKKEKDEDVEEAAVGNDKDNKEGAEADVDAANRKRSRSPSAGSESQSPTHDADKNGEGSPAPKRTRADSDEKSADGDADGTGDDDE